MREKISKFCSVLKKDGIIRTSKKTYKYIMANYINKINLIRRLQFKINRKELQEKIKQILNESNYERLIVWRGSFGWNVPLYQRPQHIAKCLSDDNCLILYEVTRMTDKTKFIDKIKDNLFLINYEIKGFEDLLWHEIQQINKQKYLQLYSTCWDVSEQILNQYTKNGFKLLYEYIDDLNPVLAGTKKLPENVKKIHQYVCENQDNALVVTSADRLYNDITSKRKGEKNVILATNGVDYEHFANTDDTVPDNEQFKQILEQKKPIVGYYGALASWFDYELMRKMAIENPDINIVLIGIKYDNTFDESKIEQCSNIHYLGAINYNELPNYAKHFDVCIIPFVINEITLSTNPIKVFEYMAMKKPVVTTDMPECRKYSSVFIGKNDQEFIDYTKRAIELNKDDNSKYFETLEQEALANTWQSKAKDIVKLLKQTEK